MDTGCETIEMDQLLTDNQNDNRVNVDNDHALEPGKQILRRRTTSLHKNTRRIIENMPSRTIGSTADLTRSSLAFNSLNQMCNERDIGDNLNSENDIKSFQEKKINNIIHEIEQKEELMQNNPQSEQLRMQTIRDMAEALTIKRSIKLKLSKSVKHTKHRPIPFTKRLMYRFSMNLSKFKSSVRNTIPSFELWYSSLKSIEGHYGSGVATYFYFLRWLFIMNFIALIFIFAFIIFPQILYVNYLSGFSNSTETNLANSTDEQIFEQTKNISEFDKNTHEKWLTSNLITGEGYLTNTAMYYGYYSHREFSANDGEITYNISNAYFFVMFCVYMVTFGVLSVRTARSYRKSFIETDGGFKNVYTHKLFCGWDFKIASEKAAVLKCNSIYNELQELLNEEYKDENSSFKDRCLVFMIQLSLNIFVVLLLISTGYAIWILLSQHESPTLWKNATMQISEVNEKQSFALLTAFVVSVILLICPFVFSWIVNYEGYKNPRTALYSTLLRTFLLEIVIVAVLVTFWLTRSLAECWETSLGQEVYRLILMDFFFSVMFALIAKFIRHILYKMVWPSLGKSEFNIALNTLNLIYNQTLFWMGLFFSPILPFVMLIKMTIIFYVNRFSLKYFCQPPRKSWRAAQTHTLFLGLVFVSLLGILCTYGYILTQVSVSKCGPFSGYKYIYAMILQGAFQLKEHNAIWKIIMFLPKPGVIAGILIAMCATVYYLRAKSQAQKSMVQILRQMLVLEAKDKEFLIKKISKITENGYFDVDMNNKSILRESQLEKYATWKYSENVVDNNAQSKQYFDVLDETGPSRSNCAGLLKSKK